MKEIPVEVENPYATPASEKLILPGMNIKSERLPVFFRENYPKERDLIRSFVKSLNNGDVYNQDFLFSKAMKLGETLKGTKTSEIILLKRRKDDVKKGDVLLFRTEVLFDDNGDRFVFQVGVHSFLSGFEVWADTIPVIGEDRPQLDIEKTTSLRIL